jgi:hypothetical protein
MPPRRSARNREKTSYEDIDFAVENSPKKVETSAKKIETSPRREESPPRKEEERSSSVEPFARHGETSNYSGSFFYRPHSVTVLVLILIYFFYVSVGKPSLDTVTNVKSGVVAAAITLLFYGLLHLPDSNSNNCLITQVHLLGHTQQYGDSCWP